MSVPTDPPSSIARSVATGMAIGAALSACNIYSGLKIGWSSNMSVTGALVAFALWQVRPRSLRDRSPFGIVETNLSQTAASSAAAVSSAGLVAGIPALTILTGITLSWAQLAAWVGSVCLMGIVIAIPLRQQMIVAEPLPFPMGLATAETLRQIYARGTEALARVRMLGVAAVAAGALKVAETFGAAKALIVPGSVGGRSLANLGFSLEPSLLLVGVGGLMGARSCVSVFLGSVLAYAVLGPWLLDAGLVQPGPPGKAWYKQLVAWLLWPGVTLMVVASLTSLALSWRTLARGLGGLASTRSSDGGADDIPGSWFVRLAVLAAGISVGLQVVLFAIPWWTALIGVLLSGVLAIVGARVAGETGVTPVGAMGKVTQLVVGAALPGNVTANLMTANVTGGAASQCADLMNDLKTGHELSAPPRQQLHAQLGGALAGAVFGSAIYLTLIRDPASQLMTAEWAAPAVVTWKTVAEVFKVGVSALPDKTPIAVAVAAVAGALLAILEAKAGAGVRRFVPSPSAMGLAFVVPAGQGLSIVLGGLVAVLLARFAPTWHGRFWIVACSGVIAGEGIVGAGLSIHQMTR